MPSAEDDLAARIWSCLADTRESFENVGEDLLAEAAEALQRASVMATIQEQGKQMAFDALRRERKYASQHLQRAYDAEAALREIVGNPMNDVARTEADNERLVDLIDELDCIAEVCAERGWATTRGHVLGAARSIEWQLRWERNHPAASVPDRRTQ